MQRRCEGDAGRAPPRNGSTAQAGLSVMRPDAVTARVCTRLRPARLASWQAMSAATLLLRRWPNRGTLLQTETSGEPCDWDSTRPNWHPDQLSLSSTARRWCRSDTATAMRSITPTATGLRRPDYSSQDFHPTETSWNS